MSGLQKENPRCSGSGHSTDRERQKDMESGRGSPYSGTEGASGAWLGG